MWGTCKYNEKYRKIALIVLFNYNQIFSCWYSKVASSECKYLEGLKESFVSRMELKKPRKQDFLKDPILKLIWTFIIIMYRCEGYKLRLHRQLWCCCLCNRNNILLIGYVCCFCKIERNFMCSCNWPSPSQQTESWTLKHCHTSYYFGNSTKIMINDDCIPKLGGGRVQRVVGMKTQPIFLPCLGTTELPGPFVAPTGKTGYWCCVCVGVQWSLPLPPFSAGAVGSLG